MSNQIISGKDIVAATINELKVIQVPVDFLDTMGVHLVKAYNNMRVLYNAFEQLEQQTRIKQEPNPASAEESPEINIIEGGDEDAEKDQLEGTVQE